MVYEMKLNEKPFKEIEKGIKKIELRLYDDKRAKLKINDYIIFKKKDDEKQTIKVKVIGLLRFESFEKLFEYVDYNICGTANSLPEKLKNIHKIYTKEQEKANGILAICIKKVNK